MKKQSGGGSARIPRSDTGVAGDVTKFEIDRVLDAPPRLLRFPPALEAQFERDTGAARSRVLAVQSLLALVVFNLFIGLDYLIVPDVLGLAVVLRMVVVTGFGAAIVVALYRNPPKRVREGLVAVLTVLAAVAVAALIAASESPHRGDYNYGLVVVVMFAVMTQRLRFCYAVLACAGCLATQLVSVQMSGAFAWESQVTAVALMLATIVLALMAGYGLERQARLGYLSSLRGRIQIDRFEALSYLDPLTGLGNRRALQGFLESAAAAPPGRTLSLVIVDIDHFKPYNDHHGHLAGDDSLRRIGAILVSEARNHGDKVYRFGGEEFVVALPGVELPAALAVAERMRVAVRRAGIPHEGRGPDAVVTASFGVASGRCADRDEAMGLLGDADAALYEAKRRGRDRVYPPPGGVAEQTAPRQAG